MTEWSGLAIVVSVIVVRRLTVLATVVALSAGCARSSTVHLAEVSDEPDQPSLREPRLIEVSTDRAEVVHLAGGESAVAEGRGRLQISSSSARASVRIDSGEPLPLPVVLEVDAGTHTINALCADGSRETSTVTVDAAATIYITICGGPR